MTIDYLKVNQQTYDILADEFQDKITVRQKNTVEIIDLFLSYVKKVYRDVKVPLLELGPGAGDTCRMMEDKGYPVTAIELSPRMAGVCQKTAPKTKVIVGDFLKYDFRDQKYGGIIGVAFIHMFPKHEAFRVYRKILSLLRPEGILYLSTTQDNRSEEGLYLKTNFRKKISRFRRRFTKEEFTNELVNAGFRIINEVYVPDRETKGAKTWMRFVMTPKQLI